MGSTVVAFIAGLVTILNPCVLPILPILVGSALGERRYGPAALAGGLVLSFSTFGLLVIAFGFSVGLDEHTVRTLTFLVFGAGVAASILAFAYGSRRALGARKARLQLMARYAKPVFGGALILVGALILSGGDRAIESWALDAMPLWLVQFTTRF